MTKKFIISLNFKEMNLFTGIKDLDLLIFRKLGEKDLCSCLRLNKTIYKIISENEQFWKDLILTYFGEDPFHYRECYNTKRLLKELFLLLKHYDDTYIPDRALEEVSQLKNSKDLLYFFRDTRKGDINRALYGAGKIADYDLMDELVWQRGNPVYALIGSTEVNNMEANILISKRYGINYNDIHSSGDADIKDAFSLALGMSGNAALIEKFITRSDDNLIIQGIAASGNLTVSKIEDVSQINYITRGMAKKYHKELKTGYFANNRNGLQYAFEGLIDGDHLEKAKEFISELNDSQLQYCLKRAEKVGCKKMIELIKSSILIDFRRNKKNRKQYYERYAQIYTLNKHTLNNKYTLNEYL